MWAQMVMMRRQLRPLQAAEQSARLRVQQLLAADRPVALDEAVTKAREEVEHRVRNNAATKREMERVSRSAEDVDAVDMTPRSKPRSCTTWRGTIIYW